MTNSVSPQGESFTVDKEAIVTRAYKDSGGVLTIGVGGTMLSRVFTEYWMKTKGHALRLGDTITRADAIKIFRQMMAEEYAPFVVKNIGTHLTQHAFDGASDMCYNAGTGSTKWKWAQALKVGKIAEACRLLLTTAITVGGVKVIPGLKNRRKAQARLIEFADYGNAGSMPGTEGGPRPLPGGISNTREEIADYQRQLKTLGLYTGICDGKAGKGSLTEAAVKAFQRKHGLRIDGVVGPATRATLKRAVDAKLQGNTTLGGGVTMGGGGFLGFDLDPVVVLMIGGGVMLALFAAFVIWNNRGVIFRTRTPA